MKLRSFSPGVIWFTPRTRLHFVCCCFAFLTLFTPAAIEAISGSYETARVSYISFTSAITPRNLTVIGMTTELSSVAHSDDSPFEAVELPYSFMLFGMASERIFVSPNGALHFSPVQPCPDYNVYGTQSCTLSTAYRHLIAGLLADLDPSTSSNASIMSYRTNEAFTVEYQNVSYFGTSLENTFRISLFHDSHVELAYDHIATSEEYPSNAPGGWLSGLRAPTSDPYTLYSDAQVQFEAVEWGDGAMGVYPAQAEVRSGNQFNVCPMSRSWCVSPAILDASHPVLRLSTVFISCVGLEVEYGVIASLNSSRDSTARARGVPCVLTSPTQLQCNTSLVLAAADVGSRFVGSLLLWPAWRPSGAVVSGSSNFTAALVDALTLTIVQNSSDTDVGSCISSPIIANFTDSCDECSICRGNLSCVGSACAAVAGGGSYLVDDYGQQALRFAEEDCIGDCVPTAIAGNTEGSSYEDWDGQCCAYSEMDCSGLCGGNSTASINGEGGARYCCPAHFEQVDCAGVCGGTATRDACGVCEGRDSAGSSCFDADRVLLVTGVANNTFFPVFDVSQPAKTLTVTYLFNVTNLSNQTITAIASDGSPNADDFGPALSFSPAQRVTIDVGAKQAFNFTVSLEDVHRGRTDSWEVKTILVTYSSTLDPDRKYLHRMKVNPASKRCRSVSDPAQCRRLPACVLCLTYSNIRVLRAEPEAGAGADANADTIADADTSKYISIERSQQPQQRLRSANIVGVLGLTGSDGGKYSASSSYGSSSSYGNSGNKGSGIGGSSSVIPLTGGRTVELLGEGEDGGEEGLARGRALFTEFFPFYVEDDDESVFGGGSCVEGWLLEDCPSDLSSAAPGAAFSSAPTRQLLQLLLPAAWSDGKVSNTGTDTGTFAAVIATGWGGLLTTVIIANIYRY